jgi:predicted transcriptional regulator
MQKTTVYLDAADYRALKRIAARNKRQPAELVREAVAEYAARHAPRKAPKSLGAFASGRRDLSERAEELLKGMGRGR